MKLHYQECFETEVFVTVDGRIAMRQIAYPDTTTIYLTSTQALQIYEHLADWIHEAKEVEKNITWLRGSENE